MKIFIVLIALAFLECAGDKEIDEPTYRGTGDYLTDYKNYETQNIFCDKLLKSCYKNVKKNNKVVLGLGYKNGRARCWTVHEKCIIKNYKKWLKIKKKYGYK